MFLCTGSSRIDFVTDMCPDGANLKELVQIMLCYAFFDFFSVKIMLLLVLHLSVKKGLTVLQNFLLSVISLCLDLQRISF